MYSHNNFNKKIKCIIRWRLIHFVLCTLLCLSLSSYANGNDSYAVFTLNQQVKKLSENKARMLYRGKVKRLQGLKVELSDWSQTSEIRYAFYLYLLGKDVAQMNAYWASLSFSGKARPPKVIKEDTIKALLEWVSEKPMRIGYAPMNLLPKTVNVLYVVKQGER